MMNTLEKTIITTIFFFSLIGCSPVFMAGSATGSMINGDPRAVTTQVDDQEISAKVSMALMQDSQLKDNSSISSAVYNYRVLLTGRANTPKIRAYAETIVKQVPNVTKVYNMIEIGEPLGSSDYANDSWITTKVKSAFITEKNLKSIPIKVVTEDQVVYLMGLILPSQAKIAINAAQNVDGVTKVVNLFEYQH